MHCTLGAAVVSVLLLLSFASRTPHPPPPLPEQRASAATATPPPTPRPPSSDADSAADASTSLLRYAVYRATRPCTRALPAEGVATQYSAQAEAWTGGGARGGASDDNTEGVTAEEALRWKGSRLLPAAPVPNPGTPVEELWNVLAPWIGVGETYPDPLVLEFNADPSASAGSVGSALARQQKKTGVVNLWRHSSSASFDDATYDTFDTPNYLSVRLPGDASRRGEPAATQPYAPFFKSCHLFNSAFLLRAGGASKGGWQDIEGPSLLPKIANMSRVTFVEVDKAQSLRDVKEALRGVRVNVEDVAASAGTVVYRVTLLQVERACKKTWTAEEVQWGRSTLLSYDAATAAVSFRVLAKKKGLGRTIHPMSYIPHVNAETLGALGLSLRQRVRLLGQQLGVSRYPDPMLHNWVWAGGGVQRIDRVDKRYERDVNESATYWGQATVGYLTLLSDNLCMARRGSGFPSALPEACGQACGCCISTCSYAPVCPAQTSPYCEWGRPVCGACLECSRCLQDPRHTLPAAAVAASPPVPTQCPFNKYKTWSGAVKVWRKWRKEAERDAGKETLLRQVCAGFARAG